MQKSLHYIKLLLLVLCIGGAVSACKKSDDEKKSVKPELTIFIHQPRSGIESYLDKDLEEVDKALLGNPELSQKVNVLYFRNNADSGKLYQKVYTKNKKSGLVTIENILKKEYPLAQTDYTSPTGLHQILSDVMSIGQTEKYGMVIGCHANGWLPSSITKSRADINTYQARNSKKVFGMTDNVKYDTSYETLARAIEQTGKKLEFLLIDDCNSQNIEVAYELRNACHYLIGSVTEIGIDGQSYDKVIPYLYAANYSAICDNTLSYYTATGNKWGTATLSVVDCSQAEQMAIVMKEINKTCSAASVTRGDVQVLDGYDQYYRIGYNVFYDFSDYVHNLCSDDNMIARFESQLNRLIVYNIYTDKFNSCFFETYDFDGNPYLRPLIKCCGISCSDLCSERQTEWQQTAWYIATH